ncbi:MAG: cytochrome C oxidase subunit IV family protein [Microthrixaceae bacterium]
MSTDVAELDDHSPVNPGEHHTHGPTDRQYFNIFFVLVVLTALEVSTYWWEEWFGEAAHKVAVPLLFVLMIIKFLLVAMFFMHLKFDSPILKRIFYGGVLFGLAIYLIALTSMNFWSDSGNTWFNDPPPAPPAPSCATSQLPGPCPD